MKNTTWINQLLTLQKLDKNIKLDQSNLSKINLSINKLENIINNKSKYIENINHNLKLNIANISNLNKKTEIKSKEIKELQNANYKKIKQEIYKITEEKLNKLNHELTELNAKIHEIKIKIIQYESIVNNYKIQIKNRLKLNIKNRLNKMYTLFKKLNNNLNKKNQNKEKIINTIDKKHYEIYNNLLQKNIINPITHARDIKFCSNCNMELNQQLINDIKNKKFTTCNICNSILYHIE